MNRLRQDADRLPLPLCAFALAALALAVGLLAPTGAAVAQRYDERFPDPRDETPAPDTSYEGHPVADVRVVGAAANAMQKIRGFLQTRVGRPYDSISIEGDVRRLAASGMFADVRTRTVASADGPVVVYEVVQRPTVEFIKVLGNKGIRDKVLIRECGVKVGDSLNVYMVDEARRKIEQFYGKQGYDGAKVTVAEGADHDDQGIVFVVDEGAYTRIWETDFVGNVIASDARLQTQIKTKPGWFYIIQGQLNRQQLDEDVDRLTAYYRSLGFFQAQVGRDVVFGDDKRFATVAFVIEEGPRYRVRNLSITGNSVFPTEELLARLELKDGEFFDLGMLNRDRRLLADLYGERGYVYADVKADTRFHEEPGALDLVYAIAEGEQYRVGEIRVHIEGEYPHTRRSVVLTRAGELQPGEIIDINKVRAFERRLKASQLFVSEPHRGVEPKVLLQPREMQEPGMDPQSPFPKMRPGQGHTNTPNRGWAPTYRGQSPGRTWGDWAPDWLKGDGPTDRRVETRKPPFMDETERLVEIEIVVIPYRNRTNAPTPRYPSQAAKAAAAVPAPPTDAYRAGEGWTCRGQSPGEYDGGYAPADPFRPNSEFGAVPAVEDRRWGDSVYDRRPMRANEPASSAPADEVYRPAAYGPPGDYAANGGIGVGGAATPAPYFGGPRQPPEPILPPFTNGPIDLTPADLSGPRMADFDVWVREAQTGRFMLGAGINSEAGLTGSIVIDERNFDATRIPTTFDDFLNGVAWRGAGQGFRLEALPGTEVHRYIVTFTEPYLLGTDFSFSASGYYFTRNYFDYDEKRGGGRLQVGRRLTPDISLSAAVRAERVDIDDLRVTTVDALNAVEGQNDLYVGRVGIDYDTRDNPFSPTEGFFLELAYEQAFGDFNYPRGTIDFRQYFLMLERPDGSGRHTLSYLLRAGVSGEETPLFENFFAGGYSTLRGFDFRGASPVDNGVVTGGRFRFLGSVEYQAPITADDMLKLATFCDFGTVETDVEFRDFRVAPGVGLRIFVPALGPAPIALDFAFPVMDATFDEGQTFSFFIGLNR